MCQPDGYGRHRRPDSLAGQGGESVTQAIRGFTTDIDLINYRLDIQDDFQKNPELVEQASRFHGQVQKAKGLHFNAYLRDSHKNREQDKWGRWIFRDWFDIPRSFATLHQAINDFQTVLGSASSTGMEEVNTFLEAVKDHALYQSWQQNLEMFGNGARYVVGFGFDMVEGVHNVVELGMAKPDSELGKLLRIKPTVDGVVEHGFDEDILVRRFTGLVSSDIGHVIEGSLSLDFEGIEQFCDVLVKDLTTNLSFYAALGSVYGKYEEIGIPSCRPIVGEGTGIEIRGGIHPVVARQAAEKGLEIVLNDYHTDDTSNCCVITGPNDGGKSCYAKTVTTIIAMAQAGLMCPAKYVRIGTPVNDIYTHFPIKDDIEGGKGKHRTDASRARRICEAITPRDFLIYDEPCGGTDPVEAEQISKGLLAYARAVGLPSLLITHLHGISNEIQRYKRKWAGVKNLQAEIVVDETGGETLTHKIINGRSGSSYGSRIALEEGIDSNSLSELFQQRLASGELNPEEVRNSEM